MNLAAAKVRIGGRVQGVGYRYFCYRRALDFGLTGWVRNDPDGAVSLLAEGEKTAVESLIAELRIGPPTSSVSEVQVAWLEVLPKCRGFEIDM